MVLQGQMAITSCSIHDNQVRGWGGGLDVESGCTATVTDTYFYNNTAATGGGIGNSGTTNLQGSTELWDNSATLGAGIANVIRSTVTASGNVLIYSNTATDNGGGIANCGGTINFNSTGIRIENNTAGGKGGALYNSSGTMTLTGLEIDGNGAQKGGWFYAAAGSLTFTNCNEHDDTASVLGPGGCYVANQAIPTATGGTNQGWVQDTM
jgi:predicted outer membrane repeat protein